MKSLGLLIVFLALTKASQAGLHLSLEKVNELPCQWRGLLPDLRKLRTLAVPNLDNSRSASLMHSTYADALLKLESAAQSRALTADEAADLGALHVRFGQSEKAIAVLRTARRQHPEHFALAANLGTAWQMAGDLNSAFESLDDAVKVAPPKWKPAEEAHRKLVQSRRQEKSYDELDPVFELAIAQQIALWLPGDGRVLWMLGEVAHAAGDVRTAANILDGCVSDFSMKSAKLREHRQSYRAAADALEKKNEHAKTDDKLFKSSRALMRLFNEAKLPPIDAKGINNLPWAVLTETTIARPFKPQFLKYVESLDGKRVSLVGYMRPTGGEKGGEIAEFLLTEYAIGCWFCEVPDAVSLVLVELKGGVEVTRNAIRVEGTLTINRTDPEAYLFRIDNAVVRIAD